jgi:hypothetical protein
MTFNWLHIGDKPLAIANYVIELSWGKRGDKI